MVFYVVSTTPGQVVEVGTKPDKPPSGLALESLKKIKNRFEEVKRVNSQERKLISLGELHEVHIAIAVIMEHSEARVCCLGKIWELFRRTLLSWCFATSSGLEKIEEETREIYELYFEEERKHWEQRGALERQQREANVLPLDSQIHTKFLPNDPPLLEKQDDELSKRSFIAQNATMSTPVVNTQQQSIVEDLNSYGGRTIAVCGDGVQVETTGNTSHKSTSTPAQSVAVSSPELETPPARLFLTKLQTNCRVVYPLYFQMRAKVIGCTDYVCSVYEAVVAKIKEREQQERPYSAINNLEEEQFWQEAQEANSGHNHNPLKYVNAAIFNQLVLEKMIHSWSRARNLSYVLRIERDGRIIFRAHARARARISNG